MSLTSGDGASGGDVSLREHLESRIDGLAVLFDQRIRAAEIAFGIAMGAARATSDKEASATDRRFDGVNEFRAALNDMVGRLMPRAESEQRHALTTEKLGVLDTRLTRIEGATIGIKGAWAVVVAVIAASAAAIGAVVVLVR